MAPGQVEEVEDVLAGLGAQGYLADDGLATAVFLALRLQRPLLLEGDAGVGKTEVARALATWTGGRLVRLQCHDGIDAAQALYEWDHARQLLHLRAAEAAGRATEAGTEALEGELYDERFLIRRPLLAALDGRPDEPPPVLLIDEIDRADDEFEAFLLEMLSDNAVTIPELGTFRAEVAPVVIITSNRTRDLHEALKRRCLYHWIEHPDLERELEIVRARLPHIGNNLAHQVCAFVQDLRWLDLYRSPGVGETLDWAAAFHTLGRDQLDPATADRTLGVLLKERDDLERIRGKGLEGLVDRAAQRASELREDGASGDGLV